MNDLLRGTAAGALASLILVGYDQDPAQTEITEADPETRSELNSSCSFYNNILTLADEEHFNGAITANHQEMAAGAYQAMLQNTYWEIGYDPVSEEFDETIVTFSEDEKEVESLQVGEHTLTYTEPAASVEMMQYEDQCAHFETAAATIAAETDISIRRLYEYAVNGALGASRDPHSSYLWVEANEKMRQSTKGEFGGLGIEVTMSNGFVKVASPIEGTPAAEAGLEAGDLITELDGQPVRGMTLDEAVDIMRGDVGTDITLTVQRGDEEPFEMTITRDKIVIHAVESKIIGPDQDTGYIKVKTFSGKTTSELIDALYDLKDQAARNNTSLNEIVIDFRGNPGGLLPEARSVSDLFVENGRLVAVGQNKEDNITYAESIINGNVSDIFPDIEVKVLQNQGSASASEIVAAAMKDAGFEVIGVPSFGKGSVQTLIPVTEDGERAFYRHQVNGSLRLTTDAFFPGNTGLSNQNSGVIPNIQVVYNDVRDERAQSARREVGLERSLISTEQTRAGNQPELSCNLKEEFAGALSQSEINSIPADLVMEYRMKNEETGEYETVQVLDADLDCALNRMNGESDYTEITPYEPPAPRP